MSKAKKQPVDKETGEVNLPRIRRQRTAHLDEMPTETNTEPSMTVPNMSMTVLQMLDRHRKGMPITGRQGVFTGDQELPDLDTMDLVDRNDFMDSVAAALVEVKARIAATVKTKEEKEFLEKVDEEVRKRLATVVPKKVDLPTE